MGHAKPIVLVVDDEALLRMATVDRLEDEGFTVLEAANADQAIRVLTTNTDVRLVFTDIDMPGTMDGLKLAAAIRDRWPAIKIVVTSGHRTPSKEDMPLGTAFFSKPYNSDKVVRTLQSMTGN